MGLNTNRVYHSPQLLEASLDRVGIQLKQLESLKEVLRITGMNAELVKGEVVHVWAAKLSQIHDELSKAVAPTCDWSRPSNPVDDLKQANQRAMSSTGIDASQIAAQRKAREVSEVIENWLIENNATSDSHGVTLSQMYEAQDDGSHMHVIMYRDGVPVHQLDINIATLESKSGPYDHATR